MHLSFKTIAARAFAYVLPIIAVTTMVSVFVVFHSAGAHINKQTDERMISALDAASLKISAELNRNAAIVGSIANFVKADSYSGISTINLKSFFGDIMLDNDDTFGCGVFLEPSAMGMDESGLALYSYMSDGQIVTEAGYGESDNFRGEEWYESAFNSDSLSWSGVYYDTIRRTTVVSALYPLYDTNMNKAGVVRADMELLRIKNITDSIRVGETGKAMLFGQSGEYISFIDTSRTEKNNILSDSDKYLKWFGTGAIRNKTGQDELSLYGKTRKAYFTEIPETAWELSIIIDKSEISSSIIILSIQMAVAPIAGLILIIGALLALVGYLKRIVDRVNKFASLAAEGDYNQQIVFHEFDEFGKMQTNLNKMMANMEKMRVHSENTLELAQEASRAKTDFLSNMSHEIRTPMNAIIGMTKIGKSAKEPDRKDYAFRKIEDASTHLLGIINDILDMSKVEANKLTLSLVDFNFEAMLSQLVGVISFRVDERKQRLIVRIDPRIPAMLKGDDQRLSQVITNLLSNAVKFTPEGGNIYVTARLVSVHGIRNKISVDVTDTGIGISSEQQKRLFQSFNQADNSTSRKFGGTGLGLAISRHIVQIMGGTIWIESELGKGAKFVFEVMLDTADNQPAKKTIAQEGVRLLVVDDSPEVLRNFLETAVSIGAECETAANDEEALEKLKTYEAQICYIGTKTQETDGCAFAPGAHNMRPNVTVVLLISSAEWTRVEESAHEAGISFFLQKPVFPSALLSSVNEIIGSEAQSADAAAASEEDELNFEGQNLLLAEDVDVNREIVTALLEPTGLQIDCAENGEQALEMFSANPEKYGCIFMDLQMPIMDGLTATRRIRSSGLPHAQDIPIVAMTANVFKEDIERCHAAGMNAHVGKPLNLEEVFSILKKYLKKEE